MELNEVLAKITSDSGRVMAKKSGITERTLLNQISNQRMPLDNLIKVADTYGYSPIRALIDIGAIDEAWTHVPDIDAAIRLADDEQLTDELLRRIQAAPNPMWEEPVGDLEAKRRSKNSNKPEQSVSSDGYDPLKHAGYSGPDEDAMRGYGEEDDDHIP